MYHASDNFLFFCCFFFCLVLFCFASFLIFVENVPIFFFFLFFHLTCSVHSGSGGLRFLCLHPSTVATCVPTIGVWLLEWLLFTAIKCLFLRVDRRDKTRYEMQQKQNQIRTWTCRSHCSILRDKRCKLGQSEQHEMNLYLLRTRTPKLQNGAQLTQLKNKHTLYKTHTENEAEKMQFHANWLEYICCMWPPCIQCTKIDVKVKVIPPDWCMCRLLELFWATFAI